MQRIIRLQDGTEIDLRTRWLTRPSGNIYRRERDGSWRKKFYVSGKGEWISYAHIDSDFAGDGFGDDEEKPVTEKGRVSLLNRLWKEAKEKHRERTAADQNNQKKTPRLL
jgi:hypothetical protein